MPLPTIAQGAPFVWAVISDQSGALISPYPAGASPLAVTSGNQANAVAAATLNGVAGRTTYISGFQVYGSGATAALVVDVTVSNYGPLGATAHYTYTFALGVAVENQPLVVAFNPPVPAPLGQGIAVSCPASGAGGTNNTVNAQGYQI